MSASLIRARLTKKYSMSSWIATAASERQSDMAETLTDTSRPPSISW
jgi:hypothetical protein